MMALMAKIKKSSDKKIIRQLKDAKIHLHYENNTIKTMNDKLITQLINMEQNINGIHSLSQANKQLGELIAKKDFNILLKREYFASQAMNALISNDPHREHPAHFIAMCAVQCADALMVELAK
jgi:hypothetical protein